ncbi:MAG: hypothetical protein HY360_23270 [Verrucomicrobia bacterium]|nr:hypothetical protein [Verrucomicrobiota bacterium]
MNQRLRDFSFTHGAIKPMQHPRLRAQVTNETAIRYVRFMQRVRVERLELPRSVWGRIHPSVPTHPAHLIVSVLDRDAARWKKVREVDIPPDPRVAGEGLSQSMSLAEMETRLRATLQSPPFALDLGGLETDHLRVECDREHPVWPSHCEFNGGPHHVPYGILEPLAAFGQELEAAPRKAPYRPLLQQASFRPRAPRGMSVRHHPMLLLYEGKNLSIGFSLRRPMLLHLGWDAFGGGQSRQNRLLTWRASHSFFWSPMLKGVSGPLLSTLDADAGPHLWTGEVSVKGNRVCYRNLRSLDGVSFDATFTVEPERVLLKLRQHVAADTPVIEAEAWRLVWDSRKGITGVAALPTERAGRNGDAQWPCWWSTDGVGCLACNLLEGDPNVTRLQVETVRSYSAAVSGLVLAPRHEYDASLVLPAGTRSAAFEWAVTRFEPRRAKTGTKLHDGVARHWSTIFACFRAEHRGFSNNSVSVNGLSDQAMEMELIAHTQRPACGPDPLAMGRFTIGRALLDGGGYAYCRNLYLDSDPNLVVAAGRLHQAQPDLAWLRRVRPGLEETIRRMAANLNDDGLAVCRDLSGNSGSNRRSSNAWDNINFGHLDAYSNAWIYRAFRNAAAMLDDLDDHAFERQCRDWAARLCESYARAFLNLQTGWVIGWRSRDGQAHDHAFTFVNGTAIAFGLLERKAARRALANLERLRDKVCPDSDCLGAPSNLLSIPDHDKSWDNKPSTPFQPTLEVFTDGSLSAWSALYYLRALSLYGFKPRARKLALALAQGYADGLHNGGEGSGVEFRSWEGLPCGYEGTLSCCFAPLYSIAIELGYIQPTEPEWWPPNG